MTSRQHCERNVAFYWADAWSLMWRAIAAAHRFEVTEGADQRRRRWMAGDLAHAVAMLELSGRELEYWRNQRWARDVAEKRAA